MPKIARATTGVYGQSPHLQSLESYGQPLLNAQLTHCIGLNDVCDSLQLHSGPLSSLRGATPPKPQHLSHANRERPAAMAEQLFWAVLEHLGNSRPVLSAGRAGQRFARNSSAPFIVD